MRVGLALGGGGLTGTAFHAGVITALAEHFDAREADVIVGTSAGSTAAALMRGGFPPRDYVARVCGRPLSAEGRAVLGGMPPLLEPGPGMQGTRGPASAELLRRVARRPWRYPVGIGVSAALPRGTRPMDGVDRFRAMFDQWPQERLWIVAVDLQTGQREVFGRDLKPSVADAVAASCAVPGYYAPVEIGGRSYIDGGAWSMVSLDLLAGEDLDLVIVSAPLSTTDWVARDPGNAMRVPLRLQLQRERRAVGGRVLVVAPDARMRAVMGSNSMSAARRVPVAVSALEYAAELFRRQL